MAGEEEFERLVLTVSQNVDRNKFNVAMGFFQEYVTTESDSSGKRFCYAKLHYKDSESKDIDIVKVPLLYIGTPRVVFDHALQKDDDLLILFSDRSLEQWKDSTGTEPQKLENPVKDSINHSIAIPVVSHKYVNDITTTDLPGDVGGRVGVKSGSKIQIGNDTVDLLKSIYDSMTEIVNALKFLRDTITFTNGGGATGPPTNAALLTPIITNIETLKTGLEDITKF